MSRGGTLMAPGAPILNNFFFKKKIKASRSIILVTTLVALSDCQYDFARKRSCRAVLVWTCGFHSEPVLSVAYWKMMRPVTTYKHRGSAFQKKQKPNASPPKFLSGTVTKTECVSFQAALQMFGRFALCSFCEIFEKRLHFFPLVVGLCYLMPSLSSV